MLFSGGCCGGLIPGVINHDIECLLSSCWLVFGIADFGILFDKMVMPSTFVLGGFPIGGGVCFLFFGIASVF